MSLHIHSNRPAIESKEKRLAVKALLTPLGLGSSQPASRTAPKRPGLSQKKTANQQTPHVFAPEQRLLL